MFARLENDIVVELFEADDLSGMFTEAIIATCVECDATVQVGWVWDGGAFTPPTGPSDEELAESVRAQRNRLLAETDWTQLPDAPLTADEKLAWATYRQELRDMTDQNGFPGEVIWPEI